MAYLERLQNVCENRFIVTQATAGEGFAAQTCLCSTAPIHFFTGSDSFLTAGVGLRFCGLAVSESGYLLLVSAADPAEVAAQIVASAGRLHVRARPVFFVIEEDRRPLVPGFSFARVRGALCRLRAAACQRSMSLALLRANLSAARPGLPPSFWARIHPLSFGK